MSFGKQIKKFRAQRDMSQPQLAELIGIEQSYLSKLENDKSVPSSDIFKALLNALELSLDDFMQTIGPIDEHHALLQIPDINNWFKQKRTLKIETQRRLLYICSLLIVLGVSVFYAGISKKLFSEVHYQYESIGVIAANEPDDIFHSWRNNVDSQDREKFRAKRLEMDKRRDEQYLLSTAFKGLQFIEPTPEARRLYHFVKERLIERPINGWLEIIGVFIFSIGLIGFFLERRLYKVTARY